MGSDLVVHGGKALLDHVNRLLHLHRRLLRFLLGNRGFSVERLGMGVFSRKPQNEDVRAWAGIACHRLFRLLLLLRHSENQGFRERQPQTRLRPESSNKTRNRALKQTS
jgi:hypothetical protein